MSDLIVSPQRKNVDTGIYVRALFNGRWGSYDISELTKESLLEWLRSEPGIAERTVLRLLEHTP